MRRAALVKAGALVVVVLVAVGVALAFGTPDVPAMRARIDAAGSFGPILFLVVYAGLALIPVPKAVLTAAGGVLFGLWAGAGLSLAGALVAAVISFGVGRLLGREAVDRLIRGRMARVDSLLAGNGFSTVLVVRLVPLVPFTAINYAAGLSGVRFRDYLVGSAIGMVPGCLAYAALGAYGANPWGLVAAGSALVFLIVGGTWWARRLDARRVDHPATDRTDA